MSYSFSAVTDCVSTNIDGYTSERKPRFYRKDDKKFGTMEDSIEHSLMGLVVLEQSEGRAPVRSEFIPQTSAGC